VLSKIDGTNYNTQWITPGAGGAALTWQGDWVAGTYAEGDIVRYNNRLFLCTVPATTTAPEDWPPPLATSGALNILDNFNRANGALGSNWTAALAGSDPAPTINSNMAWANVSGTVEYSAYWNVTNYTGNHQCGFTIGAGLVGSGTVPVIFLGLSVTVPGGSFTGYIVQMQFLQDGSQHGAINLYRGSGGSYSLLSSSSTFTWATGDVISAKRVGSVISVYQNGILLLSSTDGSPPANGGYIGFGLSNKTSPGDVAVTDFWGGTA